MKVLYSIWPEHMWSVNCLLLWVSAGWRWEAMFWKACKWGGRRYMFFFYYFIFCWIC